MAASSGKPIDVVLSLIRQCLSEAERELVRAELRIKPEIPHPCEVKGHKFKMAGQTSGWLRVYTNFICEKCGAQKTV